jgi:hypothetical protein
VMAGGEREGQNTHEEMLTNQPAGTNKQQKEKKEAQIKCSAFVLFCSPVEQSE